MRGRPDIVLIMAIVCMVGTFGLNFQMTTAIMATAQFHKGSGEYGLLGSIMAIGSLGGALLAARREKPRLRLVIGATLLFGVFATVSALMPTYGTFAVSLVPVGLASLTLMTSANATVQAQRRARDARPGDGPLHGDLHGRHPDRRTRRRLGRRDAGPALDHPDRRPGLAGHRPGGVGLRRPHPGCAGALPARPDPAPAGHQRRRRARRGPRGAGAGRRDRPPLGGLTAT
nr:hypothetical protein [Angustibacter aerolatus]